MKDHQQYFLLVHSVIFANNRLNKLCAFYQYDNEEPTYKFVGISDKWTREWEEKNRKQNKNNMMHSIIKCIIEIPSKIFSYFKGYESIETTPANPSFTYKENDPFVPPC